MKGFINDSHTEFRWNLVGLLGKILIDIICGTVKVDALGFEKVRPIIKTEKFIFAMWHSRILLLMYLHKWGRASIIASQSKDGEIISRILQRLGHEVIRGSSSKGGLRALTSQIRFMTKYKIPGLVTPDGPRGPRFKVQPGVIKLAKKTGFPIVPITYSGKRIKIFGSWDRFIMPLPFTKCRVVYGNPVYVPGNAGNDEEQDCLVQLEEELCSITHTADSFFGHEIK
jgi:lysophospholipid acyltransferase (LPLAT)-like uncharacterized protein